MTSLGDYKNALPRYTCTSDADTRFVGGGCKLGYFKDAKANGDQKDLCCKIVEHAAAARLHPFPPFPLFPLFSDS